MHIRFRHNSILLLGDTHSYQRTHYVISKTPNLNGLDIVFLGDGGEGFGSRTMDEVSLRKISLECEKRDVRLYCIRGNHSNPEIWGRGYGFSHLVLVPDYHTGIFPCGKRALRVGGGVSIDRTWRKSGLDYWPDEVTPYKKIGEKHDFLFAHDAPDYFNNDTASLRLGPFSKLLSDDPGLFDDCLEQRNVMARIVEDAEVKRCFSGHYHNSKKQLRNKIYYRCLDIEELLEFDASK